MSGGTYHFGKQPRTKLIQAQLKVSAPTELVRYAPPQVKEGRKPEYSQEEINAAFLGLMTGPNATRPRWKTLKRVIIQMRRGHKPEGKRIFVFNAMTGETIAYHPTKGFRGYV